MSTIMVLEDDPAMALAIRRIAEECDYEVCVCDNVADAIALDDDSGPFSLYIVDYTVVGGKGIELVSYLTKRWGARANIVAHSAEPQGALALMRAGARMSIAKGDALALIEIIERTR